ncbi:MAG TPA: dockerin type I domain-containing protein [Chthoniobacterales bacterium]
MKSSLRIQLFIVASSILITSVGSAGPANSAAAWVGYPAPFINNSNTTGAPVNASQSRVNSSASSDTSLGSMHVSAQASGSQTASDRGFAYASSRSQDSYTINGGSGQGTAHFTFYLSGNFSGSTATGTGYYIAAIDNGPSARGDLTSTGAVGELPPQTLTYDVDFQFGQPFDVGAGLTTQMDPREQGASGTAGLTLRAGGYTVTGSTDYTGSSGTGVTRGAQFAPGTSYSGFSAQNNVGYSTTAVLRDGTASTARNVSMSFVAPPSQIPVASDAVDLQGTTSDPVVLQMSYSPVAANQINGGETLMRLAWVNFAAGTVVNATGGNSGGDPQFFNRAYNPATDFHLGYFGIDTTNKVVWAVVNHNSLFVVAAVPDPFALASAVSRKMHNDVGPFDINLPLTGPVGVESRRTNGNGNHQLVLTFNAPVTSIGNVALTSGTGTVANTAINGATVTVDLTGVANEQIITLGLTNVSNGSVTANVSLSMGLLLGDVTGDGRVNSADATGVRNRSGQATDATNYRFDVNADSSLNSADASVVRSRSGTTIYP